MAPSPQLPKRYAKHIQVIYPKANRYSKGRSYVDPGSFLPSSTCPQDQHLGFGARHIPVPWPLTWRIYGEFRKLEMAILGVFYRNRLDFDRNSPLRG